MARPPVPLVSMRGFLSIILLVIERVATEFLFFSQRSFQKIEIDMMCKDDKK
jgi:hypothetical protein